MKRVQPESGLGRRVGTVAFWVKGEEVYENDSSHIAELIRRPDQFGVTSEQIRTAYDKLGERQGVEGAARVVIIKQAARNGWIRVRHYVGASDYWSVQGDRYTDERRAEIAGLVRRLIAGGTMRCGDQLKIECYDDGTTLCYFFADGGVARFLSETGR